MPCDIVFVKEEMTAIREIARQFEADFDIHHFKRFATRLVWTELLIDTATKKLPEGLHFWRQRSPAIGQRYF